MVESGGGQNTNGKRLEQRDSGKMSLVGRVPVATVGGCTGLENLEG